MPPASLDLPAGQLTEIASRPGQRWKSQPWQSPLPSHGARGGPRHRGSLLFVSHERSAKLAVFGSRVRDTTAIGALTDGLLGLAMGQPSLSTSTRCCFVGTNSVAAASKARQEKLPGRRHHGNPECQPNRGLRTTRHPNRLQCTTDR